MGNADLKYKVNGDLLLLIRADRPRQTYELILGFATSSQFPHENSRGDFPVSQDDDARKLDEYLKVFHCVFDEYLIKHKRSGARRAKTSAKGCYCFTVFFFCFSFPFRPKTCFPIFHSIVWRT